jgi:hypothetical protein
MPLPTHISEATRRLNPHLFGDPGTLSGHLKASAVEKKRIRQHQGDGMNKWERAYLAVLDIQWSHIHRNVSLPLANGLVYKLDFLVVSTSGVSVVIEGHEVKGRARPTGIAKIKMAASLYPWIRFKLVTKNPKASFTPWAIEPVLP